MWKIFESLIGVFHKHMNLDLLSGSLFVFKNRRGERVKIVYRDIDGIVWAAGGLRESISKDTLRDTFNDFYGAKLGKQYSSEEFDALLEDIQKNAKQCACGG